MNVIQQFIYNLVNTKPLLAFLLFTFNTLCVVVGVVLLKSFFKK